MRQAVAIGSMVWALFAWPMPSASAQNIKIAYIDSFSGMMADVGDVATRQLRFAIERINNQKGGVLNGRKLELVLYDNKFSAQETVLAAQKAIDAGARIITQGNGSSIAAAISDFVTKYNERHPGREVIYLNFAAIDPILTNEKCSYWHFRWDAHSDIKLQALTNYIKSNQDIKNVYLINQDYSMGQAVRKTARDMLSDKRSDIKIVGDELHPIGRISDFAPYIAKIKASGADSVITANWGSDLALLIKAAGEASLHVNWFTFYAGGNGSPTAIKQANPEPGRVFYVVDGYANLGGKEAVLLEEEFRRTNGGKSIIYPQVIEMVEMLAIAINSSKTDDPKQLANALSKMKYTTIYGDEAFFRAADHQFFQDMYVASFVPLGGEVKFDEESSGWGWKTIAKIPASDTLLPTTCKMQNHPGQ